MAAPKVSKMITDRQQRFELLYRLATTYRKDVAGALSLLAHDDTHLPGIDASAYMSQLMSCLRLAFEDLLRAEKRHLDELANDAGLRTRRDAAVAELRQVLFQLRDLLRGAYGAVKAEELGFERRLSPHPLPLLRQAQRIELRLLNPEPDGSQPWPPPSFPGVSLDLGPLAGVLQPRLRELREAIDAVTEDLAKVQGTKVAKDEAMQKFDETYQVVATSLVSAFRLAGLNGLADRITMTQRRRSRRRHASRQNGTDSGDPGASGP